MYKDACMALLLCGVVKGETSGRMRGLILNFCVAANYQMPRPMSTMPMASHPSTPTEMIVSSVMRDSEELGDENSFGVPFPKMTNAKM